MKSRIFLISVLLIVFVAVLFSGCSLVTPGEPSAKVTITSVSGYLWQTKGTGVELLIKGWGDPHDGEPGPQGPVGPAGPIGPQGPQGETGPTGPQGEVGPQGPAGTNGTNGLDGVNGIDGQDGLPGANGTNGVNGVNGVDGQVGQTGGVGATGQAGQDYEPPEYIYVYYTITNTGSVNVQEYTVTFSAETDDGVCIGIATGTDLVVGATLYSYVKIDVFNNEVTFVDYSLEVK